MTQQLNPPASLPSVAIVGEAYGEQESLLDHPFVGTSGHLLYQLLDGAGFDIEPAPPYHPGNLEMRRLWSTSSIHLTNVFMTQPPLNKVEFFFAKKSDAKRDPSITVDPDLPPLKIGHYLRTEHRHHLDRLYSELAALRPNLIIALGATAAWALLQDSRISKIRGNIWITPWGKVLPMFHPAAILRKWDWFPIAAMDFKKARRESKSPEFVTRDRELWVEPTLEDLDRFLEDHLRPADYITFDVETKWCRQISEIGFGSSATRAIHVPFITAGKGGVPFENYWSLEDEVSAWTWVRKVLSLPNPKIGQNGIYDITYLWKVMGIPVLNYAEDTMLLHHALYPGMKKGLGFLGSIYCNAPEWKTLRKEGNKRDE